MLKRVMVLKIFLVNNVSNKAFLQDVNEFGGYAYSAQTLSGRMSNARISKSILAMDVFTGKKIKKLLFSTNVSFCFYSKNIQKKRKTLTIIFKFLQKKNF